MNVRSAASGLADGCLTAGAVSARFALVLAVRWPTLPALGGTPLLGFVSNRLSLIPRLRASALGWVLHAAR